MSDLVNFNVGAFNKVPVRFNWPLTLSIFAEIMPSGLKSTLSQYENESSKCRDLFVKKMSDYGTSWRVLRLSSVVDQLYIKTKRIRTLEEGVEAKIADSIWSEYVGIVNYSLMSLIQLELGASE